MRTRFIRPDEKNRFMVRGPFTEDTLELSQWLISLGYRPVGLVGYFAHALFWKRRKRIKERKEEIDLKGQK